MTTSQNFISPMLAKKYYHDESGLPKVDPTGWLASEKIDGVRAIWNGFNSTMYSRTGKVIHASSAFIKYFEIDDKSKKPRFPVFVGKRHEQGNFLKQE
jgi:ATP-dependent DNA ligase